MSVVAFALAACGDETAEPAGRRYHVEAIADNGTTMTVMVADEGPHGKLTNGQITPLDDPVVEDPSRLWHFDSTFVREHCPCSVETTGDAREVRIVWERHKVAPQQRPPLPVAIKLPSYAVRLPQELPRPVAFALHSESCLTIRGAAADKVAWPCAGRRGYCSSC